MAQMVTFTKRITRGATSGTRPWATLYPGVTKLARLMKGAWSRLAHSKWFPTRKTRLRWLWALLILLSTSRKIRTVLQERPPKIKIWLLGADLRGWWPKIVGRCKQTSNCSKWWLTSNSITSSPQTKAAPQEAPTHSGGKSNRRNTNSSCRCTVVPTEY